MTFDNPYVLFLLLVFIPLIVFDLIRSKTGLKFSKELEKKIFLDTVFFRLFFVFAVIALACPRWGMGYSPSEYRRGLDVVFAIDISRSMDIEDAQASSASSRLEHGLTIAKETAESITGARFAAVIGRSKGYLAVPLTYDNETAIVFLESIDISSMTGRSTNLESLLDTASNAFQETSAARKIIVLISDGETHAGVMRNAVTRCIREGIVVTTVAVGSDEGRQIRAVVNDPASQTVISKRDSALMRAAAERTGGIYIDGSRDDASSVLSSFILSMSQEAGFTNNKKEPKQRRALFVILAIFFFTASKFITRNLRANKARLQLVSMLSIMFLFSSCSDGKLLLLEANYFSSRGRHDEAVERYQKALNHTDAASYAEYGLGLSMYFLNDEKSALEHYGNSQNMLKALSQDEHRELRYRNYYNSGIIMFEDGNFHSAANAFKEALRLDSEKIEAKRNLELSLISISMEANAQNRTQERQEQREILFEYIREEEEQKWNSREWAPEENYSGLDY
ncbi:MAG: VWA domain-containing protein [Treponema sp.]|nr:VWA domain-containing protein [Treponema sp.]